MRLFETVDYTVLELTPRRTEIAALEVQPLQNLFACPNERLQEFTAEIPEER